MYTYIKSELKRAIFSKSSLVYFLITLFAFLIAFLDFINFSFNFLTSFKPIYDCVDIFLISRSFSVASLLPVISPLLAALIFSDSYLSDKNSGFVKFIYLRLDKKKYIKIRLLINAVSNSILLLFSYLLAFVSFSFIFGFNLKNNNPLNIAGPFDYLYYDHKWIYFIIILIVSVIFNIIFSTLALGFSTILNNKYLSFLSPFFYYILSATILIAFKAYNLNATHLFTLSYGCSELNLISYQIILLTIGILLFYFGVLYNNEKNL